MRTVDFDEDGYTGVVIFDMAGTRVVLESGHISHYRWDEETQIYFQHGWSKTSAPPLLLKQVPAEVEIYQAGEEQVFSRPIRNLPGRGVTSASWSTLSNVCRPAPLPRFGCGYTHGCASV